MIFDIRTNRLKTDTVSQLICTYIKNCYFSFPKFIEKKYV